MYHSVLEYLERTVSTNGDRIAIEDVDSSITFRQLRERARALSGELHRRRPELRRAPVFVYLPKCADAITVFVGALYSGHFYVPADTKSPLERIKKIVDTLRPAFVITNRALHDNVMSLGFLPESVVLVENIDSYPCFQPDYSWVIDTDPVYTMFTSGSTGDPKGVVVPHRGVLDYIDWAINTFDVNETIVIGNQAPLYFDNSTLDLYLCLSLGAKLVLIPESIFVYPEQLIQYLIQKEITFIFWVPSALIHVANLNGMREQVPMLKYVLFAGEVMPAKQLNYWRTYITNAIYANLYGPTEITVDCTCFIVDRVFSEFESIPIGHACKNTHVILLTEENKEATLGEVGELCVRGSCLAHGYWGNPHKTAQAFSQNPLNPYYPEIIYRTGDLARINERGELIFVGRRDHQIKHLGYRIELGEIEAAVIGSGIPELTGACALYDNNKKEIVLFFTVNKSLDSTVLRKILFSKLPKYMIPTRYIKLDAFPMNPNGKINRLVLKEQL